MTLTLNREVCAGMYDYLRATAPFSDWNLPDSEDVQFPIIRDPKKRGHYRRDRYDRPEIAISSRSIGHTLSLAMVMGHEMIHFHEDKLGILYKVKAEHSAYFIKQAAAVCKFHGFDPKLFW